MKKKLLVRLSIYSVILLLAAGLVVAGLWLRETRFDAIKRVPPPEPRRWALHTASVIEGTAAVTFPCLATLTSSAEITITGQLQGTILKMGPREGVEVHRGDLLAQIDTRELDAQIERVRAQHESARASAEHGRKEAERERDLLKAGGSTTSRVEELKTAAVAQQAQVEALDREIRALKVRRGYAKVVAPADGIVAARLAEVGNVSSPVHPLYRLTVTRGARVTVHLPQVVLEGVQAGTPLELRHGSEILRVPLNRVHPALDGRALGTVDADVAELPFHLLSGARVSARVILEERTKSLMVPSEAVLRRGTDSGGVVFRVVDDSPPTRVEVVHVAVGLVSRSGTAVTGELRSGDRVIVARSNVLSRLADGDPVVVSEARK